jgi:hypothetical protein
MWIVGEVRKSGISCLKEMFFGVFKEQRRGIFWFEKKLFVGVFSDQKRGTFCLKEIFSLTFLAIKSLAVLLLQILFVPPEWIFLCCNFLINLVKPTQYPRRLSKSFSLPAPKTHHLLACYPAKN